MCCCKCCETPTLRVGAQVQYKKLTHLSVRPGGAEEKRVTYVSDEWVLFTIRDSKGEYIKESAIRRSEFDAKMEVA